MDRPVPDLDDWADWIMSTNVDLEKMESARNKQLQPSGPIKTIPKLPANIREKVAPQYWEPRLLKLGPYHANDEDSHCKQIKRRVFLYSLKKYGKPIEAYVAALHEMAQNLKNAYEELDPLHFQTDRDFLILMIVDGCVLVEILLELGKFRYDGDYNSDHPLWDVDGSSHSDLAEKYKHDMMLLENQLPHRLLERLRFVQTGCNLGRAVYDVIECIDLIFYSPVLPGAIQNWFMCPHVLDLYRQSLFGRIKGYRGRRQSLSGEIQRYRGRRQSLPGEIQSYGCINFNIPSATDLNDAGIRFRMSRIGISAGHGKLMLPRMFLDGESKWRFINIIAYEQLQEDPNEVTSYIYFMSCLLRDANDVRILRSNGIIRTDLPNDEIAEMFKSLTKDIIMRDPHAFFSPAFRGMSQSLIETFDKKNKAWKKDLWQNYLRSPWAIVSLVVAFVLFALTVVQTVYTMLGYYKSK